MWVCPESGHFVRAREETGTIANDVIENMANDDIVVKNLSPDDTKWEEGGRCRTSSGRW